MTERSNLGKLFARASRLLAGMLLALCFAIPAQAQWAYNGDDVYNTNSGRISIGTTGAPGLLTVANGLIWLDDRGDSCCADFRMVSGGQESHLYTYGSSGRFGIHKYGTGSASGEVFSILSDGKVGIGTTNPSTALHVVGDITVTGNIAAKYQDLAEWVPSIENLKPGTVVTVDPEGNNTVLASRKPYDTRVAGVVSAQPGIVLGEAGEGKIMVATTGRVKVRVDATKSPIRAGDLLVASGKEGTAMKSEPVSLGGIELHRPGTLIGKALEPLAEGEGEILVLLSLQ